MSALNAMQPLTDDIRKGGNTAPAVKDISQGATLGNLENGTAQWRSISRAKSTLL